MRARVLFIFIAVAFAALAAVTSRANDKASVPPTDQSATPPSQPPTMPAHRAASSSCVPTRPAAWGPCRSLSTRSCTVRSP